MKKIELHNYEEFAIDFINNELSSEAKNAFTEFLSLHPDIADEILLFDLKNVEDTPKSSFTILKKELNECPISEKNFDEYCIATLEGDLGKGQSDKLNTFLRQHTNKRSDFELYKKCFLPQESLVMPHKERLKRKQTTSINRHFLQWGLSLTAAATIAFAVFFLPPQKNIPASPFASVESIKPKPIVQPTTSIAITENTVAKTNNKSSTSTPKESQKAVVKRKKKTGSKKRMPPLEKLEAKYAKAKSETINIHQIALISSKQTHPTENNTKDYELKNKAREYLYATLISKSINGLSKMTESDIDYLFEEGENGQPAHITVKSRFGQINRTLAQQ